MLWLIFNELYRLYGFIFFFNKIKFVINMFIRVIKIYDNEIEY